MDKIYKVTRTWFVEAERATEAITRTKNWKHDSVCAIKSTSEEFMNHDRWAHIRGFMADKE